MLHLKLTKKHLIDFRDMTKESLMIFEEDQAFLEHFGVKGMKWGRRTNIPKAPQSKLRKAAKISIGIGATVTATLLLNKRNVSLKDAKRQAGSSESDIVKELLSYNYKMSGPGFRAVQR
jgi:ribosomal protein S12